MDHVNEIKYAYYGKKEHFLTITLCYLYCLLPDEKSLRKDRKLLRHNRNI